MAIPVTITNRWPDLPAWFEFHPLEVGDGAVWEMKKRLDAGYKPKDVMDGPSLWRVKAGDRLAWVTINDSDAPVKELLTFKACALVLGGNSNASSERNILFGAPDSEELPVCCGFGDARGVRWGRGFGRVARVYAGVAVWCITCTSTRGKAYSRPSSPVEVGRIPSRMRRGLSSWKNPG